MISIAREDLVVLMESGYIYLGMTRYREAREVFEGVMLLIPHSDIPEVALGNVYFCERKFDQAIRAYHNALKKNNTSAFAMAHLGEALFFKGKRQEAIAQLTKAVSLDPEGKSGQFARTLMEAIEKGFAPNQVTSPA